MSDRVERFRELMETAKIDNDAAEEISRLRTQVSTLQARVDAGDRLIAEHNKECESECVARDSHRQCHAYTSRGLKCPDCPVKNWSIDAQIEKGK